MSDEKVSARRAKTLAAARWCFLNFGFAKTTLEDIAKRAELSRTLLYRTFQDKDAIYQAVFADWIASRRPAAMRAAAGPGTPFRRLLDVCSLLALEPWAEMAAAPMGHEFLEVCEKIDPESDALYQAVLRGCVTTILGDAMSAEVFLLAFDGMFADRPPPEVLGRRTRVLAERFTPDRSKDVPLA